ncbi:PHD finger protein ALFIN-LIKE 6-like [Syzygium oleosum]|uniref:PHD finger protein ALFIN-LIKE 6-like n=1 Tax=Syzygium oleosum TaxID=219896 RepID=UPI0024B99A75|nr:PHD finger protein ALFIN-LIKE 6-like [Syzygium oleosum]
MARNPEYEVKVLDIVRNFRGRHSGTIKALTTEKGKQCLVGLPNGTWEVKPPQSIHPPDLPWPVSYCNLGMNQMSRQEWVERVAAVCDPWLLTVAFYSGGCAGFTKRERQTLFQEINELPTVSEIVQEFGKSNDQSRPTMLKKPKSFLAVNMPSPHEDESGAAIEDGYNDGSSSYEQSKSSGTFVNSSDDDSGAQNDDSGAATEDGNNDGSSSYGQSKSSGTHVSSSDDDSRTQKDSSGAAMGDGHNDGSSSSRSTDCNCMRAREAGEIGQEHRSSS